MYHSSNLPRRPSRIKQKCSRIFETAAISAQRSNWVSVVNFKFLHYVLAGTLALCATTVKAERPFTSPDILVLGDSQLSFGAGPAFVSFLTMLDKNCGATTTDDLSVGVIGVRSTSLATWVAKSSRAKGPICNVDPKWRVNAGAYGSVNRSGNQYVQIGQGAPYQFCKKGKSAFEAMFENSYYTPRLVILFFLGNAAERWAGSAQTTLQDVAESMRQIPQNVPCIFMTTAPPYSQKVLDLRLDAQSNLQQAFASAGKRCTFIPGLNAATIAANLGRNESFRRTKSGKVKDPFHPTEAAAAKFLRLNRAKLCKAIASQLMIRTAEAP